jgi:hypothetical protein
MVQPNPPRVYADFQNADPQGRLRLNCDGTARDLARQQVRLYDGLVLTLYSDDVDDQGRLDELEVTGVVQQSSEEQCWVARIDWSAVRHVSEQNGAQSEMTTESQPTIVPAARKPA